MDPETGIADLKATRLLAHKLFEQCRKSPGSYKLLAGSVKELRNVLEDLEDFHEDPSDPGSLDPKLSNRIARSNDLLERLDTSLASWRASGRIDVLDSTVGDFKTALDSIQQELQLGEDAISSEDISSHMDQRSSSATVPASASGGSISASAHDGSHGLRLSSHTSSYQSLDRQDSAREKDSKTTNLTIDRDNTLHRRPSEEKEMFVPGVAHLTPISPSREAAARARSPSLGWNSPFRDPMSMPFEQASDLILRDDEASPTVPARPRSRTGPVTSMATHGLYDPNRDRALPSNGLGIWVYDHDQLQAETGSKHDRSRAHSVSGPLVGQPSVTLIARPTTSPQDNDLGTGIHQPTPPTPLDHIDPGLLSPNAGPRSNTKSSSGNSTPSITFSIRSVENDDSAEAARRSAESFRDELTAVLDNAFGDSQAIFTTDSHTEPGVSEPQQVQSVVNFSPPPARRPPSPPKKRPIPKIPKRSSTAYRIVNGDLPVDSSSDEEDLYSTSKPSSPTGSRSPNLHSSEPVKEDPKDAEGSSAEILSTADSPSKRKPSHAEQVLIARAAYAPPLQIDTSHSNGHSSAPTLRLSTPKSGSTTQSPAQSPALKRHSTSTGSPNELRAASERSKGSSSKAPAILERAATIQPQQRPRSPDQDAPTELKSFGPPLPPRPIRRAPSGKEMVPGVGLEPGSYIPSDPEIASRSLSTSSKMPNVKIDYKEWYAPGGEPEATEMCELDLERINGIIHFFNGCSWDTAQKYLEDYLVSLIEQDQPSRARRVRHLIGVCLSFKGQWNAAITCFLSAMRTPINEVFEIDDGDCAAAYWLGDCYSLLNQRPEALLAYCIAERSSLFHHDDNPRLSECIIEEQETVRLGVSKADFEAQWALKALENYQGEAQSILDLKIVSQPAAKFLLETEPRRNRKRTTAELLYDPIFGLDQNRARSQALIFLDRRPTVGKYHNLKLVRANFNSSGPWPCTLDPFFTMANVRHGRLLTYECDLIAVFNSNAEAKVPKSTALSRLDCFTATDLNWLITTIRQILRTLEMEWSEVANVEGTWFVVRYSFMQTKIATTYYFSIALFRQSFRTGYGVDICSDGMCSSRIVRADWEHLKGVHSSESKRIKKLIRDFLEEAAKQEAPVKKKEPATLQPESKTGKSIMGKSFAAFRQRKRSGEDEAAA